MLTVRSLGLLLALAATGPVWAQPSEYLEALKAARNQQHDRALTLLRELIRAQPDFGRAYIRLVDIAREAGQLDAVRGEFEVLAATGRNPYAHYGVALANIQAKHWDAAEQRLFACIEESPEFLWAYGELANLASQRQRTPAAITLFERVAKAGQGRGAPEFGLGFLHMLRAEYPRALEFAVRATAIRPGVLEFADAEYFVFHQSNRRMEALGVARRMLQSAVETGDVEWRGRLLGRMGMIHLDLGDLTAAAAHLEECVRIVREFTTRRSEEIFRGNLGTVYARQGRYADALREYQEALALARQTGDRPNEGRDLGQIGEIYADMGEYSRVAQTLEQALAIAWEVKDRASEASQLGQLSLLYDAFGEPARALQLIERSLAITPEVNNPWLETRLLEIQGLIYRHLGRPRDSLTANLRGITVARRVGSKYGEAAGLWRAGDAHAALGELPQARDCYQQAFAIAEQIGARTIQAMALGGVGGLERRAGDFAAAARSYQRALEIGDQIRSPEIQWQAHAGLAKALAASRPPEALAHYRAALESVEQVRDRLTLAEERAGFLEDKIGVYRDAVALLMTMHRGQPSAGYDADAFGISERAHARALLDLVAGGKGAAESGVEPALLARRREIEASIASLQSRLVSENRRTSPDRARLAKLDAELSTAAEEHSSLLRRIRERTTAEAGAANAAPVDLARVRQLLGPEAVLLEYSLGERESFLFAVSADRYVVARLPAAAVITERVRRLRKAIAARPTRLSQATYLTEARQLYRDLLGTAAPLVTGRRRWIVVPDGVLHYLPFEALLEPGKPEDQTDPSTLPYVVRKHALSYVHSASVLAELERNRRPAEERSLVAFADPVYAGAEGEPAAKTRGILQSSAARLPRLPQTAREVRSIAELYPSKRLFLREQATEEQAKAPGALDARVVQFAVHGLLNEERPQFSGLALSQPPAAAEPGTLHEDGLLQVYEILNLRVNAEMVVLSACETGLGRERQGEGLLGLTQAFLQAGAASVVVSLWSVEDRSTADLMIGFHRQIASGKADRVEALRQARLALITGGGAYSHPHYWAPFVLVGLPR